MIAANNLVNIDDDASLSMESDNFKEVRFIVILNLLNFDKK